MSAGAEDLLRAALRYAKAGWPVFRCQPGKKVPLDGSAGFKDGTTDVAVIEKWWRGTAFNVAMPTGALTADVLDVDVKPDGSGWAAFNRLKRAGLLAGASAMIRTRSGGLHVYFAGTDQPCGRLPGHHLDFKATGGYVLIPPSFVEADDNGPAGSYELMDHRAGTAALDWTAVRALLDPPRPAQPRPPRANGDISRLVAWLEKREQGDRNYPTFWAAREAIESGHADQLEEIVAAAVRAGLRGGEREARRCVASALRRAG